MFLVIIKTIAEKRSFELAQCFFLIEEGKTNALKLHISQSNREKHGFTANNLPIFY